jgi:PST family polysaccharide transporter
MVGVVLWRTVFGPTVFGLYAVSQLVLAVLLSVNELGVSSAIIRWDGDIYSFARTVFTLSTVTSAMLYVVLYVTAPSIARVLGSPNATTMLRVLCICVIIDAACAVSLALLTREFAQGRRMVIDLLNFGAGTGLTVWLAFLGFGAMSFAWGGLAGTSVAMVAAMVAAPRFIVPGWNSAHARQLLRYGLPLAGASLFTLGVFNIDSAIVGATLGAAFLGLYQLAFNIASWPVTTISQVVQRVSFAGFSRVADSRQGIGDAFTQSLSLLMTLTVPPCVLLATLASPVIGTIYGQRWVSTAAPALSLLALLGLMRVAYGFFGSVIAAADHRKTLMVIQGIWLVTLIPVLIVGARARGVTGVSAGHVIVAAGLIGPAFMWAIFRVGISMRVVFMACLRPLVGGVLMAAVSLSVVEVTGNGVFCLAAATISSSVVYLAIVYPTLALLKPSPSPDGQLMHDRLDELGVSPPEPAISPAGPFIVSSESQQQGLKALLDVAALQAVRPPNPATQFSSSPARGSELHVRPGFSLDHAQRAIPQVDRHESSEGSSSAVASDGRDEPPPSADYHDSAISAAAAPGLGHVLAPSAFASRGPGFSWFMKAEVAH